MNRGVMESPMIWLSLWAEFWPKVGQKHRRKVTFTLCTMIFSVT